MLHKAKPLAVPARGLAVFHLSGLLPKQPADGRTFWKIAPDLMSVGSFPRKMKMGMFVDQVYSQQQAAVV